MQQIQGEGAGLWPRHRLYDISSDVNLNRNKTEGGEDRGRGREVGGKRRGKRRYKLEQK